jgi:hypothetical protein
LKDARQFWPVQIVDALSEATLDQIAPYCQAGARLADPVVDILGGLGARCDRSAKTAIEAVLPGFDDGHVADH